MTDDALQKGKDFEVRVAEVLATLCDMHPTRVRVREQPRLELNGGGFVVPDFEVQFDLLFEEGRYLIECQNRKRSSPQVAHKIRHIKGLSSRNRFIFVHAADIPEATRHALETDGVMVMSFEQFASFVARLELQVRIQEKQERPDFDQAFRRYFRGGRGPGDFGPMTS